jgi:hypothetical protein
MGKHQQVMQTTLTLHHLGLQHFLGFFVVVVCSGLMGVVKVAVGEFDVK